MYDLIVNAPNIRTGGGLILLKALYLGIEKSGVTCLIIINEQVRNDFQASSLISITLVKQNLISRLKNEFYLKKISRQSNNMFFFGNLPPLFRHSCNTILYMQNAYIINAIPLSGFPIKTKCRITVERFWFRIYWKKINTFMVQTTSMKLLLSKRVTSNIQICPFIDFDYNSKKLNSELKIEYIYPSSGEPHKNHKNLIYAWIALAAKGYYPTLHITLDLKLFSSLLNWINLKISKFNLNIKNLGYIHSRHEILSYIRQSKCLIYPSWLESYGLPLIEAQKYNIPILAPELDYVRDIVTPNQTFNAQSPISISLAVLRFMNVNEKIDILQPEQFVKKLLNKI